MNFHVMLNQITKRNTGFLNCHFGLIRRLELGIAVEKKMKAILKRYSANRSKYKYKGLINLIKSLRYLQN